MLFDPMGLTCRQMGCTVKHCNWYCTWLDIGPSAPKECDKDFAFKLPNTAHLVSLPCFHSFKQKNYNTDRQKNRWIDNNSAIFSSPRQWHLLLHALFVTTSLVRATRHLSFCCASLLVFQPSLPPSFSSFDPLPISWTTAPLANPWVCFLVLVWMLSCFWFLCF